MVEATAVRLMRRSHHSSTSPKTVALCYSPQFEVQCIRSDRWTPGSVLITFADRRRKVCSGICFIM